MKKINRSQLRGKKLDKHCIGAKTTTGEYGSEDNRVFCFGLVDLQTDSTAEECKGCKAHVDDVEML